MTGEELLRYEQELNGFRLEEILGKDIDSRLIFKSFNHRREKRVVKIIEIKEGALENAINQAIFYCQINHPHITKAYDFMIRNNNRQLALFMEGCDESLADPQKLFFNTDSQIDIYAKVITETLSYIHNTLNIAHCDIRLESVQVNRSRDGIIPKISFYNVTNRDSVPPEVYTSYDFSRNHEKQSDVWSLGLLLLELYSRRRIHEILPDLKERWKHCYKAQGFNNLSIFQYIKNKRVKTLLMDILKRSARDRPNSRQIFERLCTALTAPQSSEDRVIEQPLYNTSNVYRKDDTTIVTTLQRHKTNNHLNNNPIANMPTKAKQQKYATHKQAILSVNSDNFRLSNTQNRQKVRILNLSGMKIVKIQPILGMPNLQWLYLENNMIEVIENLEYVILKGLHLGSNRIKKIENLEHQQKLQQLYLQNNQITKIQNLDYNSNLQELFLNDNRISVVEGIGHLLQLKTIALNNNKIDIFSQKNITVLNNLKLNRVQINI